MLLSLGPCGLLVSMLVVRRPDPGRRGGEPGCGSRGAGAFGNEEHQAPRCIRWYAPVELGLDQGRQRRRIRKVEPTVHGGSEDGEADDGGEAGFRIWFVQVAPIGQGARHCLFAQISLIEVTSTEGGGRGERLTQHANSGDGRFVRRGRRHERGAESFEIGHRRRLASDGRGHGRSVRRREGGRPPSTRNGGRTSGVRLRPGWRSARPSSPRNLALRTARWPLPPAPGGSGPGSAHAGRVVAASWLATLWMGEASTVMVLQLSWPEATWPCLSVT